jgi:hypothetical protein
MKIHYNLAMKTLNLRSCFVFAFSLIVSVFLFTYTNRLLAEEPAPAQPPAQTESQPASKAIAQVVWVKGTVKAMGLDKKERILKRRDDIFEKDTIVTDKDSTGQIVFSDNSLVALNKATEFKVDQYKYTAGKDSSEDKYIVTVAKGGFRSITGAIGKSNPDNYKVNTPVATIGVRGTEFIVAIDKSGQIFTKIIVGSINVKTTAGAVVLTAGTDKLYAKIDSLYKAPQVVTAAQVPVVLSQTPNILPAKSTLPETTGITPQPATMTTTPAVGGAETAAPPAGSIEPVAPEVPSSTPSNAPSSGFCIS